MGSTATMGPSLVSFMPRQDGVESKPDLLELKLEVMVWERNPICQKNAHLNRQFLASFAINLVQRFRVEEAQLKQAKSPALANRRKANRHLALRLRNLMAAADQCLDVTGDIQTFLEAWRLHQEQVPVWQAAVAGKGH